jgi:glutathione synthase/RimK-type ligase-like ATP-grasp enzyme
MSSHLIVVQRAGDWRPEWPVLPLVTAEQYLTEQTAGHSSSTRIINLCHAGQYQGIGYYCSLLGEARRQRVLPSVRTLLELRRSDLRKPLLAPLHKYLQHLHPGLVPEGGNRSFLVAFGHCTEPHLADLARQLFLTLPAPLLYLKLGCREGAVSIRSLSIPRLSQLDAQDQSLFVDALQQHLGKRWHPTGRRRPARFDLAILVDPAEAQPPSNEKALQRFELAAGKLGIASERITRANLGKLAEFDALFIRATTNINHYTYRFAQRAEAEDLVVIDDPQSILRCTNKVYLKELLDANGIPIPRTVIIQRGGLHIAEQKLGYPMVIKIPDGSFSRGMHKVGDRQELVHATRRMFRQSALLLAQEFLYTPFDWRIGVVDGEVIYACRYYMSRNHWQIIDYQGNGRIKEGGFDTLAPEDAPPAVLKTALRAARLIGQGLYGVDLKETPKGPVVIEVNDNPSIDAGVEDKVSGKRLYEAIMQSFLNRMYRRVDAGSR